MLHGSPELHRLLPISGRNMATDTITLICDARLPTVLSTVIMVLYFIFKVLGWLKDNFHAIPNKIEGQQVMPTSSQNKNSQATDQGNQSGEKR